MRLRVPSFASQEQKNSNFVESSNQIFFSFLNFQMKDTEYVHFNMNKESWYKIFNMST